MMTNGSLVYREKENSILSTNRILYRYNAYGLLVGNLVDVTDVGHVIVGIEVGALACWCKSQNRCCVEITNNGILCKQHSINF